MNACSTAIIVEDMTLY